MPTNDLDLAFLHNSDQLLYMARIIKTNEHLPKTGLRSRFTSIEEEELIDLLEDLLQFNPGFRPSASDCLKRALFASLRKTHPVPETAAVFTPL